jgi:sec-independent protein translocase protein TatC
MSVVEHLEELRYRLLVCVAAVTIGTIGAFVVHDQILALLLRPLPMQAGALGILGGEHRLAVTGVGEAFAVVLRISLAAGLALGTPVWVYHLWAFVAPALGGKGRRYALLFTVLGVALFVTGLAVGFVTLRYPIAWLRSFSARSFVEIITADNYFTFVAYFLLAFGLTFELPLVLTGLVVMGVVSPDALRTHRVSILIGLWTASCFVTPGADPYSPLILGVAFTALFFVSMGLIRFINPASATDPIQISATGVVASTHGAEEARLA